MTEAGIKITKVPNALKTGIIIAVSILGSSGVSYVLPTMGAGSTTIDIDSQNLATKEYVNTNYVSRDKLMDTVNNLQNQITANTEATKELKKEIKDLGDKIDKILDRLPRKYDDGQ